ncbi:MAG TPA: carboxypeptidase-like regulatory domain-containing protein [Thermoanaerobaculia bacterium]|nr:carboxypeptidase-like regulatory domain-containing protein [Thermoanaerobaculia bacterium]
MPEKPLQLQVALDASQIKDLKPDSKIKVVTKDGNGALASQIVTLGGTGGKGAKPVATFPFAKPPGTVQVAVGPADATDEELFGLQTLTTAVSAHEWTQATVLRELAITPHYWAHWLLWCRTFTIHGRVVCANGQPVPGARVQAFDVDFWWWWSSLQQVGPTVTTDANGQFTITFRWCCGFLPWWWWSRRIWRLETVLAEAITPVLERDPQLRGLALPSPRPSLQSFNALLQAKTPGQPVPAATASPLARAEVLQPEILAGLQPQLAKRIAAPPAVERLRLWPWFPWQPWFDCSPDIIFRVTQDCNVPGTVIVNETVWNTRFDIPTNLNVTLTANDKACCRPIHPSDPHETCALVMDACGIPVNSIGDNPPAPPPQPYSALAGYAYPGSQDRPFGGAVRIDGLTGGVDYYLFQWSTDGGASWNDMPAAADGGFSRLAWTPPSQFDWIGFPFTTIDGRLVIETRQHYESTHPVPAWNVQRYWMTSDYFTLFYWLTENNFADGTYRLRAKGYTLSGSKLVNEVILPLCSTKNQNGIILTIDNRFVNPVCPSNTVHLCTTEPSTEIVAVHINGVEAKACAQIDATKGGPLVIDFVAYDPDRHLDAYSLIATYGNSLFVNLLTAPGAVLTPSPVPASAPPALQVGPAYAQAVAQGAVRPYWAGGAIRLTIPDLHKVFTEPCCYQLELRAYKRTIVSCNGGDPHQNLSELSFMVTV